MKQPFTKRKKQGKKKMFGAHVDWCVIRHLVSRHWAMQKDLQNNTQMEMNNNVGNKQLKITFKLLIEGLECRISSIETWQSDTKSKNRLIQKFMHQQGLAQQYI